MKLCIGNSFYVEPSMSKIHSLPGSSSPTFCSGARFHLGARQAIIVRDDITRDQIQALLGNQGLVLTLLESKGGLKTLPQRVFWKVLTGDLVGLEFDDVLLYNFFGSSPASDAQWRTIGLHKADTGRNRVIELELKRLYVAITRARLHIWIWDPSKTADSMLVRHFSSYRRIPRVTSSKNYWLSRDLIKIHNPSEPLPLLAGKSVIDKCTVYYIGHAR